MEKLVKINKTLEKIMPLLTPLSLLVGVIFPGPLSKGLFLVPWVFAFLTFSSSLGSNFRDVAHVFQKPAPLLTMLVFLHVVVPSLVCLAGKLLFPNDPYLVTGMVLEFVIPTAIVSMMWVGICGGNATLSLALVLTDTIAAPFVIPLSLRLFIGSTVKVDALSMMKDLVFMIALPALLAIAMNQATHGRVKQTLAPALAPFSKVALMFVIMANSTKVAPFLRQLTPKLIAVTITMLVFSASAYGLGWLAALLLRRGREDIVSMTFNSGMRNISTGAVIAGAFFPAETVFPVMISVLFQQILAAIYGYFLGKRYPRREETGAL